MKLIIRPFFISFLAIASVFAAAQPSNSIPTDPNLTEEHDVRPSRPATSNLPSNTPLPTDIDDLKTLGKAGNVEAQAQLGKIYLNRCDHAQSIYWYEQAAEQGDKDIQFQLAMALNTSGNNDRSVFWFRKAAEQGHQMAGMFAGVFEKNSSSGSQPTHVSWSSQASSSSSSSNSSTQFYLGSPGKK